MTRRRPRASFSRCWQLRDTLHPTLTRPISTRTYSPATKCNTLIMYIMPLWVILSSNVVIAAGTIYGGWGIIETMGCGITTLTCSSGFAANAGAVTAIFGATQLGTN